MANVPRSGHPAKVTVTQSCCIVIQKAQLRITNEVNKNRQVPAKSLKTSKKLWSISVLESVIHKSLNRPSMAEHDRKMICSPRHHCCTPEVCKRALSQTAASQGKCLRTDYTKVELFRKKTLNSSIHYPKSEVRFWEHRDLGLLHSLVRTCSHRGEY